MFSALQFRFTEYQNESRTFCRRLTVSSYHSIPELIYDCRWTDERDFGKTFIFQYEAESKLYTEAGKYWFKLPSYTDLGKKFTCTLVCVSSFWSVFSCSWSEYFKTTSCCCCCCCCYYYYYYYYYYFTIRMSLFTGLFFLVLLLNQQWSPLLRLRASHCSTFRIVCDVPSIAVFCSESIECFPGAASKFFLKLLVTIPVAPIITGTIVHFRFHIRCISIHKNSCILTYFPLPFARHFCLRVLPHLSVCIFSLFLIII